MKMNLAWHTTHPLPRRATMTQLIRWHRDHAEHCSCRPIPDVVKNAMQSRANARMRAAKFRAEQQQAVHR